MLLFTDLTWTNYTFAIYIEVGDVALFSTLVTEHANLSVVVRTRSGVGVPSEVSYPTISCYGIIEEPPPLD